MVEFEKAKRIGLELLTNTENKKVIIEQLRNSSCYRIFTSNNRAVSRLLEDYRKKNYIEALDTTDNPVYFSISQGLDRKAIIEALLIDLHDMDLYTRVSRVFTFNAGDLIFSSFGYLIATTVAIVFLNSITNGYIFQLLFQVPFTERIANQ